MGIYIYLTEQEKPLMKKVQCAELNELFKEALFYLPTLLIYEKCREVNYGFLWLKTKYEYFYDVYHEHPDFNGGTYQARLQLSASGSKERVSAYLYGIINHALYILNQNK